MLLDHWPVRQKVNHASSVQLRRSVRAFTVFGPKQYNRAIIVCWSDGIGGVESHQRSVCSLRLRRDRHWPYVLLRRAASRPTTRDDTYRNTTTRT